MIRFSAFFTAEQLEWLRQHALATGMPMSELLRRLVQQFFVQARQKQEP